MSKFYEQFKRSLVKTISFRALIMCSDFMIMILITRRIDITLGVLFFSNFASTVLYFIHERIWNKIHWGKDTKINSEKIKSLPLAGAVADNAADKSIV